MGSLGSFWQRTHEILIRLAVDLPPEAYWLPAAMLFFLAAAAIVDAYTGRVPDPVIFFGLLVIVATRGYYTDWEQSARYLMAGLGIALVLYAVNQFYYYAFKRDAYGMGDVKWTLLAIAAFSIKPALIAWGLAAWLGLLWLGAAKLVRWSRRLYARHSGESEFLSVIRPRDHVHFAPFLFAGLLAGLYVCYLP